MQEKYKFPDKFTSNQFVKYIDQAEIKGLVGSLGNTISQEYKDQELVLLGVLKGSYTFLADLIREVRGVKLKLDFVKLAAHGRTNSVTGTIGLAKDLEVDIRDKHVLIVEEIIDTGRALYFLKERLELSAPKSLKVVTLFDKPHKRTIDVAADFIGRKIDDHFIVGYGLDIENYGRNLQDIYFLKYPQ